jgi:pimeloyl-ACP methyl ester carboxylesterase
MYWSVILWEACSSASSPIYAGIVLIDPSQEAFYEWTKTHPVPAFKEAEAQITKAPEGLRAEWGALEVTYAQARAAKVPNGIPVTLLSATKDEGMPEEARRVWIEKQKEWLSKVPGAKHIITEKSGHFIQAQEPGLVVNAIREVVDQSRKQKPR